MVSKLSLCGCVRLSLQHDQRLSPHNAQLKLLEGFLLHTFFAVAQHTDGRVAVTYHAIPSTQVGGVPHPYIPSPCHHTLFLRRLRFSPSPPSSSPFCTFSLSLFSTSSFLSFFFSLSPLSLSPSLSLPPSLLPNLCLSMNVLHL